jgi:hypothetical protein
MNNWDLLGRIYLAVNIRVFVCFDHRVYDGPLKNDLANGNEKTRKGKERTDFGWSLISLGAFGSDMVWNWERSDPSECSYRIPMLTHVIDPA